MPIIQKFLISVFLLLVVTTMVVVVSHQEPASLLDHAIAQQSFHAPGTIGHSQGNPATESGIFSYTMLDIDGEPVPLSQFKGQVIMIVNTASFCGNTPQYEGLQTLYERYRDQGFTILAFPANDFGKQEPGTDKDIAEFCYTKYALEFPLFSKITVLGEQKHPLYRYLTEETPFKGEITWNFQKFLLDRSGKVIARYRPGLNPLSPQIIDDIEHSLSMT